MPGDLKEFPPVPTVGAAFHILCWTPVITVVCSSGKCEPFIITGELTSTPCPTCGELAGVSLIRFDRTKRQLDLRVGRVVRGLVTPN